MSDQITVPDVSRWQGTIDWDQLATQYKAVIIKVSGADGGLYTDNAFARNQAEARRVGVGIWYYHFKGAGVSPEDQAAYMLNAIGGLHAGEAVMLDDENESQVNTAFGGAFGDKIKGLAGINEVLYSNLGRFVGDMTPFSSRNVGAIVAKYGVNDGTVGGAGAAPQPAGITTIGWQYTSQARVPGITANTCDLSLFYGNLDNFKAYGSPNNVPAPATPHPVEAAPAPGNGTYTVVANDGLIAIGAKLGQDWQKIAHDNGIVAPYKIFPGEVLKVYGGSLGASAVQAGGETYRVVSNDGLIGIGIKTGHDWHAIAQLNGLSEPYTIYPGQILKLDGGVTAAAAAQATYTVRSNDYLSTIAPRVGVDWQTIARLNNISAPYTIYPNEVLKLS